MSSTLSILCAVDLSGHSRAAMQHAGAVAEHFRARLIAVTIAGAEDATPDLAVLDCAGAALRSFVHAALPAVRDGTPDYEVRVESGVPAQTILKIARNEEVDLIVVGTHGMSGYRRHAFGSTTEGILRQADIPVLVVPGCVSPLHSLDNRCEIREIRAVMAPIDFSPLSGRDARIAAGIAESIGVPLLLAHVTTPIGCRLERGAGPAGLDPDTARARLRALRSELPPGSRTTILVSSGRPAEEIAALAAANGVGLIVMGLRGVGGSEGPGSIAYGTVCLTPTMLLALPPLLRRAAPALC